MRTPPVTQTPRTLSAALRRDSGGPARGARWTLLVLATATTLACAGDDPADESANGEGPTALGDGPAAEELSDEERARRALDRAYPMHGAITGVQLKVYLSPDPEGTVAGWLRVGARIRLKAEVVRRRGCSGGFQEIHPKGFVCVGDGVEVREAPIEIDEPTLEGWKEDQVELAAADRRLVLPPIASDEPLPYDYYYVKELAVPEYHRLPSRNEQRAAVEYSEHYQELLADNESRARRFMAGELPGPRGTAVAARYLDRGFFVASTGIELRASRRFVRTTGGRFIKQAQLETRAGSDFRGVEITEERPLPVAWAARTARPMIKIEDDEGIRFETDDDAEPIERQTLLDWQDRRNLGGRVMHILEGDRYLRAWFASVAAPIERPEEIGEEEPWVHIDLSEQTLVLYRGDEAKFATLVSTGVDEHATPTGIFRIQRKHITDTMSNIGPDADSDRYRIEDVPWTQYFEGSFALHTAFWHSRYGLPRSHGCVNMAPADAHRVFQATWPVLPEHWHGVAVRGTDLPASHVVITD
ncbi:MAG: L,D-transpeptidase [Myxococcota bacterium]